MPWPTHTSTNYRRKRPEGTLRLRVFGVVKSVPLSCREIAGALGIELICARAALRDLRRLGLVEMVGGGHACRYVRVKGAKPPRDRRGTVRASLDNLEPGTAEQLLVRRMRWLYGVWHPAPQPATMLEQCWSRAVQT